MRGEEEREMTNRLEGAQAPAPLEWYLVTNISSPSERIADEALFPPANLEEIIRLYGLRTWVEQSDQHGKHALGWSQDQVRSDQAIRRQWQLVCCAYSFCWYPVSQPSSRTTGELQKRPKLVVLSDSDVPAQMAGTGEKNQRGKRHAITTVLADGPAGATRVVGTLDHAQALLARVVRAAPTLSAPMLA